LSATAFLADPVAKEHDTGRGHPERPSRWDAAVRGLAAHKIAEAAPRSATEDELALCHSLEYIRTARRDVEQGLPALSTGDTAICPRSFDAAVRAAGLCLNAVDLVVSGAARSAFCVVRPPGHHATPTRGMGFCLFNNIAIAARYAQRRYGIERAAIVDWDVHHGNGTQEIFYRDPSVFFFSTHQWPWYPGTGAADETGEGAGSGSTLNCPFPAGAGRDLILGAFRDRWMPRMEKFQPGLILISAGFDSRLGDPLGHFRLTDADFADLTTLVMETAGKHCGGRIVSVLEGGYNPEGLSRAVAAHADALTR
jgi:acetoin utilization deacetylase AcuC-like enzyme